MANVYNPSDTQVHITIDGFTYVVEAKGTVTVPDAVAQLWVTEVHQFLELVKEVKKEAATVEVVGKPSTADTADSLQASDTVTLAPPVKVEPAKKITKK